jgi:hypothetical protein
MWAHKYHVYTRSKARRHKKRAGSRWQPRLKREGWPALKVMEDIRTASPAREPGRSTSSEWIKKASILVLQELHSHQLWLAVGAHGRWLRELSAYYCSFLRIEGG